MTLDARRNALAKSSILKNEKRRQEGDRAIPKKHADRSKYCRCML